MERGVIYEDEDLVDECFSEDEDDEEWDVNDDEDIERDLYDSRLDDLDEVLVLRDQFGQMQQASPQLYEHMVNSMST